MGGRAAGGVGSGGGVVGVGVDGHVKVLEIIMMFVLVPPLGEWRLSDSGSGSRRRVGGSRS